MSDRSPQQTGTPTPDAPGRTDRTAVESTSTTQPGRRREDRLPLLRGRTREWWRPALVFAASRLVFLLAAELAAVARPGLTVPDALAEWDSRLWTDLAQHGYSSNPQPAVGSTLAFFPLYPLTVRGLTAVTGLGPLAAGIAIATVGGLVATVLLWFFTADVCDRRSADVAAALFCLSPGALAFSMAYSEGLLLALAVPAVWAAMRGRWVLAGVLAGLATAVRPNALGLVPLMVLMAAHAVYTRRDWRALLAAVLSPLGAIAFVVYLRVHTGSWTAWQRAQSEGWFEKSNFKGIYLALRTLLSGEANPASGLVALGAVMVVVGFLFMWRVRPPWPLVAFAILAIVPALASQQVSTKPRMVLIAFPLFMAAGALLSRRAAVAVGAVALTGAVSVVVSAYVLGFPTVAP